MSDQDSHHTRKRRSSRIVRGTLITSSGRECDVLIRNVSSHGLGVKAADLDLKIGDQVAVQLPNVGRMTGTVRWAENGAFGIETSEEIHADLLLFGGDENRIVPKAEVYSTPKSHAPLTDSRRPGFGRRPKLS